MQCRAGFGMATFVIRGLGGEVWGPVVQRDTILAMDFMEGGSLWDLLPRTNKAGQRPFQFQHRQGAADLLWPVPTLVLI